MKTLPFDYSRCTGRFDFSEDGVWCEQRETCQRYLAFAQWDKSAGIADYQRISVTMAVRDCDFKIEVTE